jgi:hypothetical protein
MLCGMKWSAFISEKNAIRILKLLGRININRNYSTRREVAVNDENNMLVRKGKYKCWHIELKKLNGGYTLVVRGSLHKFFHVNNHGLFTGMEVLSALQGMYDLFEVDASDIKILQLEVGINLPVAFLVQRYLALNLLYHKKRTKEEGDLKGIGFYFKHDDYWIKLYQKEKYKLRFEIKYKSQAKLQAFEINTGADLHIQNINSLVDSLIPEWKEVIMRGGIDCLNEGRNRSGLTNMELKKMKNFSSTFYQQTHEEELLKAWEMKDKKRSGALQRKAHRLKTDCMKIISTKGDQVRQELDSMMKEMITEFKASWGN